MEPITLLLGGATLLGTLLALRKKSPASGSLSATAGDTSINRSLDELDPEARAIFQQLIDRLQARGFSPYVFETLRSDARQLELIEQGFSEWNPDNLPGPHGQRIAMDLVDGRLDSNGDPIWWGESTGKGNDDERLAMAAEFWAAGSEVAKDELGATGEEVLDNGGWWGFYDPAHWQLPRPGQGSQA